MTAPFELVGTTPQNEIVAGALARCDFPFERLSKKNIPVEWLDLSRFGLARGHGETLDHHSTEFDALEVRGRVLGLAWYSGKISLDLSLIADPELAGEVFLSEAAHMVDFFYMTSAHRVAVWNAAHLDDPPLPDDFEPPTDGTAWHHDHGWFDVGSYRHYVGECVDDETLALSQRGWVGPDDLRVGDEILTFDLETETTRWEVVERVNVFDDRPYRVWGHRGAEVAVTDNHRWVVRLRGTPQPPYRLVPTTQVHDRSHDLLLAAPSSDLPDEPKWDDDFVELVAWAFTEGYYKPNKAKLPPMKPGEKRPGQRAGAGPVVVTQKVHAERVAALMRRLGVAPGGDIASGAHQWRISGDLARRVKEVAPGKAPTVEWLRSLTMRQLRMFIDVAVLADGFKAAQDGRRERQGFIQNAGPRLDSFLAACALAGIATTRAKTTGECETWTLRSTRHSEVARFKERTVERGRVWCPTTRAGTFVARRGRTVFITGNSFMGLFVLAFSDYLVTIDFPDHPATLEGAALVRAAFAVEGEPPPPSPELESRRGCLPFLRARKRALR